MSEDERVHEWEAGLPSSDELTPLSQALIPQELASAFSISPEPHRSLLDVNRASKETFSGLSEPAAVEEEDDTSDSRKGAESLKRPRLVWTPQLHKRFVDVVAHLGIKSAVPKTIMQLMNVEGLTRENVASHLQKYRLYLKRMQGLSAEGPSSSSSDHLFASAHDHFPLPYAHHQIIPHSTAGLYHGFDSHPFAMHHTDCSYMSYQQHVPPNDTHTHTHK